MKTPRERVAGLRALESDCAECKAAMYMVDREVPAIDPLYLAWLGAETRLSMALMENAPALLAVAEAAVELVERRTQSVKRVSDGTLNPWQALDQEDAALDTLSAAVAALGDGEDAT